MNDLEHVTCAGCGGAAYANALITGRVVLVCSNPACAVSAEIRRRSAPVLGAGSGARSSAAPSRRTIARW